MKRSSYSQFELVVDSDPVAFQDKLNKAEVRLSSKNPITTCDISSNTFKAIIQYEETKNVPETALDELTVQGLSFTCVNCPRFEPVLNNDGSVRGSSVKGSCFLESYLRKDTCVCEWFAKEFLKGKIQIVEEVE